MSKVLTLDNLDVIKEYIDTQDQSVGDAYSQKIDEKFEEKITEINSNLEIAYNGVLQEMQKSLETLDTKHTNYEETTNVTLENLTESFNKVDSILKIKPTGNTYYSEELKAIINDIKDIKDSYGNTSNTTGSISISDLAAMLNKTEVVGQLTNNTTFGSGIINLVSNHATIKPQNIDFGTITKASIKPTNNNWSWNNNGTGHIGTNGISVNSDGKLSFGGGVQLDFYSNVKGANSIVSNIENNVKSYITNDVVDQVVEKLGETNGIDKIVIYDVLKPYDYALGYDRNSSSDNYIEIVDGVETERIRLNRLDSLEKATDINQRVNGNTTVDLKESISTMLETEYNTITKKVNGVDTDYSIMKSKRLDDIEDLLYINKTGKSGNSDVSYYNIITAIAGNPSGMPVSEKFDNVSEKGVLDMQFEAKDGLWEPKSNRLDKIELCLGLNKWEEIGKITEDSNIYTTVVNDIQKDILGNWDITIDQIKGSINRNNYLGNNVKEALYNLRDRTDELEQNLTTVDDNLNTLDKKVFGDNGANAGLKGELTTEISNLKTDYTAFKEKSNETDTRTIERINDLSSMISQLINNASPEAISKAIQEWIDDPTNNVAQLYVNKTELTNTLNSYLTKDTASSTYLSKESFNEQIKNYATDNEVVDSIADALVNYYNDIKLNAVLQDYVKNIKLTEVLANYAKTTDLTTGAITAKKAETATTAAKATQDGSGNVITNTYVTKTTYNQLAANYDQLKDDYDQLKDDYDDLLARVAALESKVQ